MQALGRPGGTENSVALVTEPMRVTIDGVSIPDRVLRQHHELASHLYDMTFGADNIYRVPADRLGMPWKSYSDGYWLMVEPLSAGEHQIKWDGMFGPAESPVFALDIAYNITVTPEPASVSLVAIGSALLLGRRRRM